MPYNCYCSVFRWFTRLANMSNEHYIYYTSVEFTSYGKDVLIFAMKVGF